MTTETKTKELIRPVPIDWWLKKRSYTLFMLRDVTSVFIAAYCLFLMCLMVQAGKSTDTFRAFADSLRSPASILFHLVVLGFAVYHSITFFNLTPRVIVVFRGDEKLPEKLIAGAHYVAWGVVSLILFLIVLVA